MKKHSACIVTKYGWVDINKELYKSINCIKIPLHDTILSSDFYKKKEGIFWPRVKKITDYQSTHDNALAYYDTEYIHHIIRYHEFTPEQFKKALLFLCDVCIYCYNHGYFLRTHLWNVTFVRGKPYLTDIRDFEKLKSQKWINIFIGHFRTKLDNHCPILASKFMINFDDIYSKLSSCTNDLFSIKNIISSIQVRTNKNGAWTDYHKSRVNFLHSTDNLNEELYNKIKNYGGGSKDKRKSYNLLTEIETIKPKTIVEVGCNNGLYCFASSKFANVVGLDYDINSINNANMINEKLQTSTTFIYNNILDIQNNLKAQGQNGSYGTIYDRCRSELLIAPAIVHHLFKVCKSTDMILEIFDKLAKRYMIIENIPSVCSDEQLIASIKKINWKIIKVVSSSPSPRKFFVCTKII
uniref:Methyltransferase domain protein n=1 Tax=Mimivirus LCMiAC01 TaxID=2506608 RepID=A0A481Z196_9VIRU|nr:MAG: methyltransferase domain protein [Mimivirus LCMiAC01]